jgi:hypothetical protein
MRRTVSCAFFGKPLVASPNVCTNRADQRVAPECDFDDCRNCPFDSFVCSECSEIFTSQQMELDFLHEEEKALIRRVQAIRTLQFRLTQSLEK